MNRFELSRKEPLWLNQPDRHYRLESGAAAVFVAQPAGVRRFLFNVAPGALIPPMPSPNGNGWQVMLLPLEAVTLSLVHPDDDAQFADWTNRIQAVIGSTSSPDLRTFNADFYNTWTRIESRMSDSDRRRFDERARLDAGVTALGLSRLAAAAKPVGAVTATAAGLPQTTEGGPLLAACRAVGSAMGIEVRAAADEGSPEDPLQAIAQRSNFRTRMVHLEAAWWKRDNGPILGYWKESGQPVALLPSPGGGYQVFDPVAGTRLPVDPPTARLLDYRAHVLYRPFPEDVSARSLLKFALGGRRREINTILFASVCATLFGLVVPQATGVLVNQAIPDADRGMIWQIGAAMLGASVGGAVFLITQSILTLRLQMLMFCDLSTGFWDYTLKLPPAFFRLGSTRSLAFQLGCLTRVRQLLTAETLRSLLAGLTSILSLAMMFWYSVPLAMIGLLCGLFVVMVVSRQFRILLRIQSAALAASEETYQVVMQVVNAISKLQVAGAERRGFALWTDAYSRRLAFDLKQQEAMDIVAVVTVIIPQIAVALSFYHVTGQAGAGLSLGTFLAFNAALTLFLTGLATACQKIIELSEVRRQWSRITFVLTASPEVDQSKAHPGRLKGDVRIDQITFRYRQDGPLTLNAVSIHAKPGECIALTGPSGSGKSTILNLLLRFETPMSGAIYLDGKELSGLDIVAVRRQIGVVTQDGKIMSGSIYENLTSGGLASMEDALEAARAAGLAEDLAQMPMGIHTVLSEGGANISGGQRQRLLIARALVRKPSILVFDEATSALDNRTQAIVTESLDRMKVTRILVAHRLSTIRNADRIYVIEAGVVTQSGTYDELAVQPGLFARLIQRQSA